MRDAVDLMKTHPALDAAVDGALLVEGEVVARLRSQKDEHLLEGVLQGARIEFALEQDVLIRILGRKLDCMRGDMVGDREDEQVRPRLLGNRRVLEELVRFKDELRESEREQDWDVLMEVLSFFEGWCMASLKL